MKLDEQGSCVLKFWGGFRGPRSLKMELPSRRELVFHFFALSQKNDLKKEAGAVGFGVTRRNARVDGEDLGGV